MKHIPNILLAVILGIAISCAAPPKSKIDRIYTGLSEDLPRLDPSILEGRKILIDPGHGGHFRGTVGQDSLEEARVNLGVALYLWGLLNDAGAEAILTRSAERDFLLAGDSSLVYDLQARVALACSLQPDILVSIHHNAQSKRDSSFNQVETYYRTGDPASMDLAVSIHRHLMRNLGISAGEVRQGNYYILRNAEMPAVIGESSYLTHPEVERKLALSNKQRLEAEAYFLGILEYFQRGIPRLQRLSPPETTLSAVPAIVFQAEDSGGLGIDPDAIHMVLNQSEVTPVYDRESGRITFRLEWDAPNGTYALALTARNLLGNSSHEEKCEFKLDLPPQSAVFEAHPRAVPMQGGLIRLQTRLLDRRGLPVADGTPVRVDAGSQTAPEEVKVRSGKIEFPVAAAAGSEEISITVTCRGKQFTFNMVRAAPHDEPIRGMFIKDESNDGPVTNASILRGASVLQTGSQAGLYLIPDTGDSNRIRIRTPGYRPKDVEGPVDTVAISPWFEGKLFGKRFLIDPQGGGDANAGPLGLSGAHVNLLVARYLSAYLQNAGASVRLTRHSEEIRTAQDIVTIANRFRADLYVEIRRGRSSASGARSVRTYHFPGSRLGPAFAESISRSLSESLELPFTPPGELVTYPLQQTACPAVVIEAPSIDNIEEELRLGESWYQRLQAYGIFTGILKQYGAVQPCSLSIRVAEAGNASNWLVVVDGTWKLLTDPVGRANFHALASGTHHVEVRRGNMAFSRRVELREDDPNLITFPAATE